MEGSSHWTITFTFSQLFLSCSCSRQFLWTLCRAIPLSPISLQVLLAWKYTNLVECTWEQSSDVGGMYVKWKGAPLTYSCRKEQKQICEFEVRFATLLCLLRFTGYFFPKPLSAGRMGRREETGISSHEATQLVRKSHSRCTSEYKTLHSAYW